jgi:hypothetical protein
LAKIQFSMEWLEKWKANWQCLAFKTCSGQFPHSRTVRFLTNHRWQHRRPENQYFRAPCHLCRTVWLVKILTVLECANCRLHILDTKKLPICLPLFRPFHIKLHV